MQISQLTTTGDLIVSGISPDGRLVAYVREQHGENSMWMLQLATGSTAQIAQVSNGLAGGPRFSPDGNYIYFGTQPLGAPKATLYRVASLGGTPKTVLDDVFSTISFSPDGKQFAFIRQDAAKHESYLVTSEADGSNVHVAATKKEPQAFTEVGPAWMPDGQHVAAVSQENVARPGVRLEVVDLGTGASTPLANLNWISIGRLSWRSNPDAIVFAGFENLADFRQQLWEVLYPSGQLREISNDLNSYDSTGLTADGRKLVATQRLFRGGLWLAPISNPDSARQITPGTGRQDGMGLSWVGNTQIVYGYIGGANIRLARLEVPGGQPTDLALPGEAQLSPAPCNGGVVYVQVDKKKFSIWSADLNGGTPREIDPNPSSGVPLCTADGRFVVFQTYVANDIARLMRVPATGGTAQKLNDLNMQEPALSPDGREIAAYYFTDPTAVPKLALMPAEGGEPTRTIDMPKGVTRQIGLAWTADGDAIIFANYEKGAVNLWIQPLGAPQGKPAPPRQWTHFSENGVSRFAISPDGKQVVFARNTVTSDIVLITHLP
jgi:Tol biopolymer transport system component